MAQGPAKTVNSQLRGLLRERGNCVLPDAQLLDNYVSRGDQASFEVLVWRHGAMVLGLCQRVLRDTHAAEDAFQATFLVLARKAASIGKQEAVGSWLYKVAYRVVLRARTKAARQRAREEPLRDLPDPSVDRDLPWQKMRTVLDAEIYRLPEKYRVPFVLCYLEGQTNAEAARQLGCPAGTIMSRLARAREKLRVRLAGCGLGVSIATVLTVLSENVASAAVPDVLVNSTINAAIPYAAGPLAAGPFAAGQISSSVVALSDGVIHSMFLTKFKFAAVALLSLAAFGSGGGFLAQRALAGKGAAGPQEVAQVAVAGNLAGPDGKTRAAGESIFRSGDELIVQISQLDQLRQVHKQLKATVRLTSADQHRDFAIDLADRLTPAALVFDVAGKPALTGVTLTVSGTAGQPLLTRQVSPVPIVTIPSTLPLQAGAFAAIEPGSKLAPAAAPRIALPDLARLRTQKLTVPTRSVTTGEITYPVIADADLPGSGSNNAVIISRQSFAPDDATKCSLYFSYRKAIYDDATVQLKEWRKMLIEVPLDRAWLDRQGDEVITVPLDGFAIHTTEEHELGKRWNAPEGYNMLGGSSSGLCQGGQSADVDEEGRIYISNVADGAGIVRFNPHTGKFEQPPVSFSAEIRQFLPVTAGITRNWDLEAAHIICTRGRLYIVFDRNYLVNTPNGVFETCSGVISLPQENWHDAEAFRRDIRLHAACWPTAQFPLYDDELAVGGSRKAGPPTATTHGITFGTFRLDLDANGDTQRLARIKTIQDTVDVSGKSLPPTALETIKGLQKKHYINVGSAGRPFVRQAYGEFGISRAGVALSMPDASADQLADAAGKFRTTFPGAPGGELTVRFDITAKIKNSPQQYGTLARALTGISQGPNYSVIAVPGEADQAIGVCEYNYFYSKLDFSRRASERKVFKSYLTLLSKGQKTGHPVSVGLGPYNSTWLEHDNALWLYITGYTGMSRLKYAEAGRPLDAFASDVFHGRLSPQPIDGVNRDNVKDFLHVVPATDGRLIDIGRGRVGRGGGAHSAGLELFDPRKLGPSQSAVAMNRCYGLFTPLSRLIYSTPGAGPRQEIFVASGNIRPEYVADISDPAQRPQNQDPKIFAYDCASGGGLRDLYGFSLPLIPGGDSSGNLAFSPCRQFLVVMQGGGTLLTYSIAQRRFVDGLQLRTPAGQPIHPLDYSKPSGWIWTAPNGRIFFHAAFEGDQSKSVNYFEVQVTNAGQISVAPHLAVTWDKTGRVKDFDGIVRCFLPDLKQQDRSYDLVLGGDSDNGGQPTVRVIDDFVPAENPLSK